MKLAVLSDIHGNLAAFDAALADLDAAGGADKTWILGDLAAAGPRPVECIRKVREMVADTDDQTTENDESPDDKKPERTVFAIGGNTDRYLVTGARPTVRWNKDGDTPFEDYVQGMAATDAGLGWTLSQLRAEDYTFLSKIVQRELFLDVKGYGAIVGYHAIPGDDETIILPDTPEEEALDSVLDRAGRLGIGGHTHREMDRSLGRWRLLNPGSVGLSFTHPGHAQYMILTFGDDGTLNIVQRSVPFDVEAVVEDLHAVHFPEVSAARTINILREGN